MNEQRPFQTRRYLLGALAFSAVIATTSPLLAQTVEWTSVSEYPANAMPGEAMTLFATSLARESGNKIVVKPLFDAAMGLKSADMPAAVREGKIAIGDAFAGSLGKLDPLFLLSSLPFVTANNEDMRRLFEAARPHYAARFAKEGQRLLYATPWPPTGIWSKKPLATPADIAGLALRVYDSTGVAVFTTAGAKPVNISFADTMPRLLDGSIEAVASSGDGGAGRKLWDHLRYFTEIGYASPLSFATLNEAQYQVLSPELRGAVDKAASETQEALWKLLETRLSANYTRMGANGMTIARGDAISPELRQLLARSAADAVEAWKKEAGPTAAALVK